MKSLWEWIYLIAEAFNLAKLFFDCLFITIGDNLKDKSLNEYGVYAMSDVALLEISDGDLEELGVGELLSCYFGAGVHIVCN